MSNKIINLTPGSDYQDATDNGWRRLFLRYAL